MSIFVVVPLIVKLPESVKLLNVTSSVVATSWPIEISPLVNVIPVPLVKCDLTSVWLGPVYVKIPVLLS